MNVSKILEAICLNAIVGGKMKPASCILKHNGVQEKQLKLSTLPFNSFFTKIAKRIPNDKNHLRLFYKIKC